MRPRFDLAAPLDDCAITRRALECRAPFERSSQSTSRAHPRREGAYA
jgi:hypothetical protein